MALFDSPSRYPLSLVSHLVPLQGKIEPFATRLGCFRSHAGRPAVLRNFSALLDMATPNHFHYSNAAVAIQVG